MYAVRLVGCLLASCLAHWLLAQYVQGLPAMAAVVRIENVQVQVVTPPPPPEPEPPKPEPPAKVEEPQIHEPTKPPPEVRPKLTRPPPPGPQPKQPPPTERPATSGDTTDEPVFGVTMDSTAPNGSGPSVAVGNTLQAKDSGPATAPAKVKPLAAPVAAVEVTKMPSMRGKCEGKYTDAAREAGVDGLVVLDLVVDRDGNADQISVVKGLGHGLDESAVATLKRCKFEPGQKNGIAVAVRIRAFKIRFFLGDDG
ncbi:MAG: energy transducer TonB [Myxococcales bacterium]|nr:energy transducer TonB [Myxococcales bacterium]